MTISNLNIFQSGTLASVTPVNENFETLRVAVNTVEQTVTTNRTYLNNKVEEINASIATTQKNAKTTGEVFCVNSGSFDVNGQPCILSISGTTLSIATPFSAKNIDGDVLDATSISDVSISGLADGTYNVFVDLEGEIEILSNSIFRQETTPTATVNDIWLDTSKAPICAKRYTSDGWEDFLKIPIGYFVLDDGSVTKTVTNKYNQNGYNLTVSGYFPMPDYTKPISKTLGVTYTAETSGWILVYLSTSVSNTTSVLTIDGESFQIGSGQFFGSYYGVGTGMMIPVAKGSTYVLSEAGYITFYPVRTV